jgi:hypothetical protein
MTGEIMIPALPCASITEVLEFYVALGFEITYQQAKPNTYGVVKRDGIELHFFSMKGYEPANSYTTCLVLVPDVDALHKAFSAGLKAKYGKVPLSGIPRMNKPNTNNAGGDKRFNIVDPGGNWIRVIQQATGGDAKKPVEKSASKLARMVQTAAVLADSKGDHPAAAKLLDSSLAQAEGEPAIERVRALVLRVGVAVAMDELALAREIVSKIRGMELTANERELLGKAFEQMAEFEETYLSS